MSEMLFDISPVADEDSKKRKPSRRKQEEPPVSSGPVDYSARYVPGYIASLDVPCERCGMSITDLAEVYRNEWLTVCGWGCGLQKIIDPIPGVLESQKKSGDEHVLRTGRHKGKTLDEVWESGDPGKMYVRGIAKIGQSSVDSRAACEWMMKKGIDR